MKALGFDVLQDGFVDREKTKQTSVEEEIDLFTEQIIELVRILDLIQGNSQSKKELILRSTRGLGRSLKIKPGSIKGLRTT